MNSWIWLVAAESNEYSVLMKYGAFSLRCSYSSLIATGLHTILNEHTTMVTSDFLKIQCRITADSAENICRELPKSKISFVLPGQRAEAHSVA